MRPSQVRHHHEVSVVTDYDSVSSAWYCNTVSGRGQNVWWKWAQSKDAHCTCEKTVLLREPSCKRVKLLSHLQPDRCALYKLLSWLARCWETIPARVDQPGGRGWKHFLFLNQSHFLFKLFALLRQRPETFVLWQDQTCPISWKTNAQRQNYKVSCFRPVQKYIQPNMYFGWQSLEACVPLLMQQHHTRFCQFGDYERPPQHVYVTRVLSFIDSCLPN